MTRTLGNYILAVLENESGFAPRGILYRDAKIIGYDGTQEELLQKANELAKQNIIDSEPIGRFQLTAYKYKEGVA